MMGIMNTRERRAKSRTLGSEKFLHGNMLKPTYGITRFSRPLYFRGIFIVELKNKLQCHRKKFKKRLTYHFSHSFVNILKDWDFCDQLIQ